MAKNRLTIDFQGFEEMYAKLDKLQAGTKEITEKALEAAFDEITPKVDQAMAPHDIKYSHDTRKSLVKTKKVVWNGSVAYVNIGFDISNGGLASIFLMYGTPRMSPDRKLYNAIYGGSTKKKVREIQSKIFNEELKKVMK